MQTQKPYTTKMKREMVECFEKAIDGLLDMPYTDNDDILVMCALAEIKQKFYTRLYKAQSDYTFSFTPTQAIAIRIMFTDFVTGHSSYLGNKLHLMSNEIKQLYKLKS